MDKKIIKSIGRISNTEITNIIICIFNKMRQKGLTTLFADEPYPIKSDTISDLFINADINKNIVLGEISNLSIENNEGYMQLNFKPGAVYTAFPISQKFNNFEIEEYKMHFYAARNEHSYSGYINKRWSTNAPTSPLEPLEKAIIADALYSIYKSI